MNEPMNAFAKLYDLCMFCHTVGKHWLELHQHVVRGREQPPTDHLGNLAHTAYNGVVDIESETQCVPEEPSLNCTTGHKPHTDIIAQILRPYQVQEEGEVPS